MSEWGPLAIKKILEQAPAFKWSLQGFGMFRLYLSKEVRLHVWDDRFAVPNVSTIHTHPWDFVSHVISGVITDKLYSMGKPADPYPRFPPKPYMKQEIVCGPGGGTCGTERLETLYQVREERYWAGRGYRRESYAIHESVPEPGTVTLVERSFHADTEHAFVFWPAGQEWVSAEPREALEHEVISMAELALERWLK